MWPHGLVWLPEHGEGVDRGSGAARRAGGRPCSHVLQLTHKRTPQHVSSESADKEEGTGAQHKSRGAGQLCLCEMKHTWFCFGSAEVFFQGKASAMPSPLCLNWRRGRPISMTTQSSTCCMVLSCPTPPVKQVCQAKGSKRVSKGRPCADDKVCASRRMFDVLDKITGAWLSSTCRHVRSCAAAVGSRASHSQLVWQGLSRTTAPQSKGRPVGCRMAV